MHRWKIGVRKKTIFLFLCSGQKSTLPFRGQGNDCYIYLDEWFRFWIRAMEGKLFLCSFSFSCQVDGLMFLRKFFWRDVPPYSEGHFRLHCGLPNRKIIQFVFIVYFVLQWKLWKNASNYGNVK